MPWYRDDYDTHSAGVWIAASNASADHGTAIQFAILDHANALVGVIGFEDIEEQTGRAMLGYWLATPVAGHGLGRQAIALAIAWARAQPAVRVIWAVVADANRASRRVLELNDFRMVGARGIDERGDTALIYELELGNGAARPHDRNQP